MNGVILTRSVPATSLFAWCLRVPVATYNNRLLESKAARVASSDLKVRALSGWSTIPHRAMMPGPLKLHKQDDSLAAGSTQFQHQITD
jgi:hypothetical protein